MRVAFRADANSQIGTGHLMRCLALADQIRALGGECTFLCREPGLGMLGNRIENSGHRLVSWGNGREVADPDLQATDIHPWLPGGWQQDAGICLERLSGQRHDWLVVDHYAIDGRWEESVGQAVDRILAIDDVADRPHFCDILLDQNLVPGMNRRYEGLLPQKARTLLGPRYALLRPDFVKLGLVRGKSVTPPRLLVMYGGADPQDLTLRTVRILTALQWASGADVVVGPLYANVDKLRSLLGAMDGMALHSPAWNIAELMNNAGLALGSPGVTSWERCACSLPSLTIAQADNQEAIGVGLQEVGAHCYLGRAESVSDDEIARALMRLAADPQGLADMSRRAADVTDGAGAGRVAQVMRELQ